MGGWRLEGTVTACAVEVRDLYAAERMTTMIVARNLKLRCQRELSRQGMLEGRKERGMMDRKANCMHLRPHAQAILAMRLVRTRGEGSEDEMLATEERQKR